MQISILRTSAEIRAAAVAWDDLWGRSEVVVPTARAEFVAHWLEQFAAERPTAAVLIEQDGRALAALPLVEQRWGSFVQAGGLPTNPWATHGDLLLDPAAGPELLDGLVRAVGRETPWPLFNFDPVALETPRWQAFAAAARRAGWSVHQQARWRTGAVQVQGAWADYEGSLGREHRRNRRRNAQMLEKAGGGEFELHREFTRDEVARLVREGFEVEDRSWKGAAGSSVLRSPGMLEFFTRSALAAAAAGCLELAYLRHAGQPIAFAYGWRAKNTHFLPKVGYDESFKQFGPGQLLVMRWLEALFASGEPQTLDFWGELAPWTESWSTDSYAMGRIVAAGPSPLGRSLVYAYENWRPRLKKLRDYLRGEKAVATG
jgi:CelD/BcsL family acetyltransferase involved in cellulose biosynthesis